MYGITRKSWKFIAIETRDREKSALMEQLRLHNTPIQVVKYHEVLVSMIDTSVNFHAG